MTEAQFQAALARHGMRIQGLPGYVCVLPSESGAGLHVYRYNAGKRRRDQLAYLLAEKENGIKRRAEAERAAEERELACREIDRQVAIERGFAGDAIAAFVEGAAYHRKGEWRAEHKLRELNRQMGDALARALGGK
jgi:hypothetical protein